jgi:hypothetical protein
MHNYFSKISTLSLLILLCFGTTSTFSKFENNRKSFVSRDCSLYDELKLSQLGLKQDVFEKALMGWNAIFKKQHIEKPNLLSIADLSQSSNSKRLYVIDIVKKKILFNTYVAHGRNSGEEFAHSFSNEPNSFQSSLGFYLTKNTYQGAHGLSMKLEGIENGINNNAEQRGIIVHGARYVHESFIKLHGRLGRSQGCPAIPQKLCEPIVNSIKGGSCFFIFYPDSTYLNKSTLL